MRAGGETVNSLLKVRERQTKAFNLGPSSIPVVVPASPSFSRLGLLRPGATRTALVIPPGQSCFKAEDPGLASCSQSCYCCHLRESSCRQDKRRGNPLKALVDVVREVKTALPGRMLSFLSQSLGMFVLMCTPRTPLDWGPVYP